MVHTDAGVYVYNTHSDMTLCCIKGKFQPPLVVVLYSNINRFLQ